MNSIKNEEILLVERSSLSGEIIVSTARQLGLPIVSLVSNIRIARHRLEIKNFLGVIISLEEDRDALLLLENIREAQFSLISRDIPIIVITDEMTGTLALKLRTLNVRRVLLKPFKVRDVITSMQMLQDIAWSRFQPPAKDKFNV